VNGASTNKTERMVIRMLPELREAIAREAEREGVSESAQARRILFAHFQRRGVLPAPGAAAERRTGGRER